MTIEQEEAQLRNYLSLQESCILTEYQQQHLDALMSRFRIRHGENTEAKLRELTDYTFTVPDCVKGGKVQ